MSKSSLDAPSGAAPGRPLHRTLSVVAATLLACLATLEIGLRASGRSASNVTEGIFAQHGDTYRLRRSMTKVSRTPSFRCTIRTNALGFRDRQAGAAALGPEPYFVFLGDSLTFGNGVDFADSFVGVFAETARREGLGVVNAAVAGHHLADQQEVLRELVATASAPPSWVVVVFTTPLMAASEVVNTGWVVRSGYLFPSDGWLLSYMLVMAGNTSSAYCFFRDAARKLLTRLSPPDLGAIIGPLEFLEKEAPRAGPEAAARFERALVRLDEEIRASGASPIYVYLPSSTDLRARQLIALAGRSADRYDLRLHSDRLRRHCEASGVPLVDLQPLLEALGARRERLTFTQDPHYDAATHRAIGEALQVQLLSLARASSRRHR
jgi:lysophospholipase L1-like esterase